MKVLVLNPSSKVTKNVIRDVLYGCWCKGKRIGGGTAPPFALLSVATLLKKEGFETRFLDVTAEGKSTEEIKFISSSYDVIVMSTSTMTINEDADFLNELKKNNGSLTTIVFGSHPTFMPEYTMKREGIDIIVKGEPEYIIRDFLRAKEEGDNSWKKINGIGFCEDGKIVLNPDYPFIENLDELPFLDVSMLPKNTKYFNPLIKRTPYITTTTSRGCPGECTFCTAPLFYGTKIRYRSADSVLDELRHYKDNGYNEIYFRDETFTVNKERNRRICEGLIKNKLDLSWICNARIGMVDKETMALMKKAGCHLIKFGVESGVQQILDGVKKGIKIEQTQETFKWAKDVGMETHAHVMLGMPGETEATVNETINFVNELAATTATFGICTPYPGTLLFEDVTKIYPEIKDGSESDLNKLHTQGLFNENFINLSREKLEKSVRSAYRSFYLRPAYLYESLRRIEGLDDFKRIFLAGIRVLDFSIRGE